MKKHDPHALDQFYMLRVTSFSLSGSARRYGVGELPEIDNRAYLNRPERPVIQESFGLHLELEAIEPKISGVSRYSARLDASSATPSPDTETYGGLLFKRKDRAELFFFGTHNLTRDLATALLGGREIFICFQGSRLYRGKASICGLEWWDRTHPELIAELELG